MMATPQPWSPEDAHHQGGEKNADKFPYFQGHTPPATTGARREEFNRGATRAPSNETDAGNAPGRPPFERLPSGSYLRGGSVEV